jgi:hypothetical protein
MKTLSQCSWTQDQELNLQYDEYEARVLTPQQWCLIL